MCNTINRTDMISALVSPKHEATLNLVKKDVGIDSPSVRTVCHIRWTVHSDVIGSILSNEIKLIWDRALATNN